ncbi:protein phosphatase 2C domain-containing protein [Desulfosarcina sp. OttesenSCG-928-A07]|nr:protein phosphatase 2C domain-containing protein [Desulfosarcina sp. OttesenSCG-928-G17]MDL2328373.1 protein phosphatase 2C domain-containing protein [Desulfosarcina sp. OttesenSCG-928-A07]
MKTLKNFWNQLTTPRHRPFRRLSSTKSLLPYRLIADVEGNPPPSDHGSIDGRGWVVGWAVHVGSHHVENDKGCEDSIAIDQYLFSGADIAERLNVSVCDGVSGGALGAVASATAANYLTGLRPDFPDATNTAGLADARTRLENDIQHVDDVVRDAIAKHTTRTGATTISAAWLGPKGEGWICRIGDCRFWQWRMPPKGDIRIKQLTEDQTYHNIGEIPPFGIPDVNPVFMAGNGTVGDPEVVRISLMPNEGLILASDGVHNFLTDQEMIDLIASGLWNHQNLGDVARTIEEKARENGSYDDVAVLVLMWKDF